MIADPSEPISSWLDSWAGQPPGARQLELAWYGRAAGARGLQQHLRLLQLYQLPGADLATTADQLYSSSAPSDPLGFFAHLPVR